MLNNQLHLTDEATETRKEEPLLIAIHELVRKLQDKETELSPYYMPGL